MSESLEAFNPVGLRRRVEGVETWKDDILTAYQDQYGLEEGFDYDSILRCQNYPYANVLSGGEINIFRRKAAEENPINYTILKEDLEIIIPESERSPQAIEVKNLCTVSPASRSSTKAAKFLNKGTIIQKERKIAQLVTSKHLGVSIEQLKGGNLWQLSEYASGLLVLHARTLPEKDVLYRMKRLLESKRILPKSLTLGRLEIFPELDK